MNRLQIFRLLRRNAKLSEKRSPAFDQNVVAKVLLYIGAAIIAIAMWYTDRKKGYGLQLPNIKK